MKEVLLDGLLRLLAHIIRRGSFSARELESAKRLLNEWVVDPEKEYAKLRQYLQTTHAYDVPFLLRALNENLDKKQRYLLLAFTLDIVAADHEISPQEEELLQDIQKGLELPQEDYELLRDFITQSRLRNLSHDKLLIVGSKKPEGRTLFQEAPYLPGYLAFLYLPSVDMIFMRVIGEKMEVYLNGQPILPSGIHLLPSGGLLRLNYGYTLNEAELREVFIPTSKQRIVFEARNISYRFPSGRMGLRPMSFYESGGRLVGIMGPSGAGKSTLLRLLSGQISPASGRVLLNNTNVHTESKDIQGLLGYVPQEDLLIEELSVEENIRYAALLAYGNSSQAQTAVEKVLKNLGLAKVRDLKVGSPLKPIISGGQRKRLNIALELVRQPEVLFLDEPLSGLSSIDALQVVDMLKTLSRQGTLVFFTLHQPSSEIYKKLDRVLILDEEGYLIYWGNPIEGLMHFRMAAGYVNSLQVECPECRRVQPEEIFEITQARRLDEEGNTTGPRIRKPEFWNQIFVQKQPAQRKPEHPPPLPPQPPPSPIKQFGIFLRRELVRKFRQPLSLALLLGAAPILAAILTFILRYAPSGIPYAPQYNDNLPAWLFVNILAILFLGMIGGAEEIIRDRKVRLRESFLHLSWSSYLGAKIVMGTLLTFVQVGLYILVAFPLMGVFHGWGNAFWILMAVGIWSMVLAYNLSDAFNDVVPIYILIPILLIPQMILSGAVVRYEKFNPILRGARPIPLIADFAAVTRWAYEAQAVSFYFDSPYYKALYPVQREISHYRFELNYAIPTMRTQPADRVEVFLAQRQATSLDAWEKHCQTQLSSWQAQKQQLLATLPEDLRAKTSCLAMEELVMQVAYPDKWVFRGNNFFRLYEPIFFSAASGAPKPLFVAQKSFWGRFLPTLHYNLLVIFLMIFVGLGLLYTRTFRRLLQGRQL
ncbi:MAG: ATP-binding cassette domain-containing protein [Bacteroidia bacterium]